MDEVRATRQPHIAIAVDFRPTFNSEESVSNDPEVGSPTNEEYVCKRADPSDKSTKSI
jgi:hypothetical protein